MSTSLATIPKLNPPLKKAEAIEALLVISRQKFDAREAEKRLMRDKLQADWDTELAEVIKTPLSINFGKPNEWDEQDVRLLVATNRRMAEIGKAYYENRAAHWDEKEERKMITATLDARSSRVTTLLNDPASRQALEALAEALGV